MRARVLFGFFVAIAFSYLPIDCLASDINCGAMPSTADESLKAEVSGRAAFLSRLIGSGQLSGAIETIRQDFFDRYDRQEVARREAALEYQMCEYLKADTTHTDFEKFRILSEIRKSFAVPLKPTQGVGRKTDSERTQNYAPQIMSGSSGNQVQGDNNSVK